MTLSASPVATRGTDSASPANARRAAELDAQLHEALALLTEKQRFVISRAWGLDGPEYSLRWIAEAMGVRHRAVQKMHARALRALARHLGGSQLAPLSDEYISHFQSVRPQAPNRR